MKSKVIIKVFKYLMICSLLFVFAYSVLMFKNNINEEVKNVNSNVYVTNLSNKKIQWGVKRGNNHAQPDLGKINKEVIEKYNGICLGNSEKKYLYLTFDEGYEAGYTEKILDVLKENQVKATFFITAHYLNTNKDLVIRMIKEEHVVGNHTVNHKSMPDLQDNSVEKEISDLHKAIFEATGYEMKYIRPPKGECSERTLSISQKLGYTTVMWSFAYMDWDENNQKGEEYAKKMITENFHNGEVMLLHGNSKDNTNVLDYIIKKAKSDSYEFKSIENFKK